MEGVTEGELEGWGILVHTFIKVGWESVVIVDEVS
jgi:hypothetical protein